MHQAPGGRDALLLRQQQPPKRLHRPSVHDRYTDGGLYLQAYVPEYDDLRWFAVERIKKFVVSDKGFTRVKAVKDSDIDPSLGLGNGPREGVLLEFSPRVAPMCVSACGTSRSNSRSFPMAACAWP